MPLQWNAVAEEVVASEISEKYDIVPLNIDCSEILLYSRVKWGKTPRQGKTPHHDISELKLFWGNFLALFNTQCVGSTLAKNDGPAIYR